MQDIYLYIDDLDTIIEELRKYVDEEMDDPDLTNRIGHWGNESFRRRLAELYEAANPALIGDGTRALIETAVHCWLSKSQRPLDMPVAEADDLGIDIALTPRLLEQLCPKLSAFNARKASAALFIEDEEIFPSRERLEEYLDFWVESIRESHQAGLSIVYQFFV